MPMPTTRPITSRPARAIISALKTVPWPWVTVLAMKLVATARAKTAIEQFKADSNSRILPSRSGIERPVASSTLSIAAESVDAIETPTIRAIGKPNWEKPNSIPPMVSDEINQIPAARIRAVRSDPATASQMPKERKPRMALTLVLSPA